MRIRVEPRADPTWKQTLAVTLFSALLALPIIAFIFWGFNVNPVEAYRVILMEHSVTGMVSQRPSPRQSH